MNRLDSAPSPYLRQHAGNPVDWWPWSEEAFAQARLRDVPVLISVGYSACHWCHVMAHESFEDAEVAQILNSNFLAVKVDREERPDVDALYMEAVQLASGRGGWPMTVLALPDGRPFWAGTYLPKASLLHLLREVHELWGTERTAIESGAARLTEAVRNGSRLPTATHGLAAAGPGSTVAGSEVLARCAQGVLARHDPQWGGWAGAPKFPQPTALEALAQHWWRSREPAALAALARTLDAMSSGGIYDHLAGGFARYSTDRHWFLPHFEKMLYDNALLVRAYTQAWQLTGAPRYRQVVTETVEYLLNPPLLLAEGTWAASEDADSEGEEGRYYTWSLSEIEEVAGAPAAQWYGASAEGNWDGKNILWRPGLGDLARPPEIEQARRQLAQRRLQRPRPGLDNKVVTEWNAMAVAALAYAGRAFDHPSWVEAAAQAATVIIGRSRLPDGRWLRSRVPGPADGESSGRPPTGPLACAGDYAWLVEAFTRLGEATGRSLWTSAAIETADSLIRLFWDHTDGAFFTSGADGEHLVARTKDVTDGACPSANATAARALARLGELTGEPLYGDFAQRTVEALSPPLWRAPEAFPGLALAVDYLARPKRQVAVAHAGPARMRPVWDRYLPDTVVAWGEPYNSPIWAGRDGPESAGLAFVCEGYACKLPLAAPVDLAAALDSRPA